MENDFKQIVEKYKSELLRFRREHPEGERSEAVPAAAAVKASPRSAADARTTNEASPLPRQPTAPEIVPGREPQSQPDEPPFSRPEPSVRPDMPPEMPSAPQARPEITTPPVSQPEMPTVTPSSPEIPQTAPDRISNDRGYIQVKTFTAREAMPVPDALVLVTKDGDLIHQSLTDENGATELIELKTVSRDLSMTAGNAKPFTTYDIQVTANGYLPVRSENVPIFGGVTSVENIAMIPTPEFYRINPDTVYENTEPNL